MMVAEHPRRFFTDAEVMQELVHRYLASVQPVQMSVATRLWMNDPDKGPPQRATRSISRKPGGGLFQSL